MQILLTEEARWPDARRRVDPTPTAKSIRATGGGGAYHSCSRPMLAGHDKEAAEQERRHARRLAALLRCGYLLISQAILSISSASPHFSLPLLYYETDDLAACRKRTGER